MPAYPSTTTDERIGADVLLQRVKAIFLRCGMSEADSHLLAGSLVLADLRGVHSHGVLRVPDYADKLLRGGVDPRGRPAVVRQKGASAVVDGNNAMGQIACRLAMDEAIRMAGVYSVGAVAIRGSNHCGALFQTGMQALEHSMIGIAATNALPTMAPWGGRDKILGINPIAVAIPTRDEPPIVFDAAFSMSSHGKIRVYHQKGLPIPEGWAADADGNPTTNADKALDGLLLPIGEYKGAGLAIVMGVLSSFLSGAAFGTELGDMQSGPKPGHDGQFVMALDIGAFEDPECFRSRADDLVRQIRLSKPASGHERCYAPGELEHETETRQLREGITLSAGTIASLRECESAVG